MEKEIHYKNISNIEATHKATHEPYEYTKHEITPREDFSQCYVAVYHIPPLKSNYPMHSHENNTEVFYIQNGSLLHTKRERIGRNTYRLSESRNRGFYHLSPGKRERT